MLLSLGSAEPQTLDDRGGMSSKGFGPCRELNRAQRRNTSDELVVVLPRLEDEERFKHRQQSKPWPSKARAVRVSVPAIMPPWNREPLRTSKG